MRAHRKLTSHERDKIAYWYAVGERIREIARRLGRSPSIISDEIKRNKIGGRYYSIRAHQASEARKHNSHKKYVLKTRPTLQSYVVGKLGLGWSPEQIAGRLRKEINEGVRPPEEYINHESIYQYIYDEPQSELRLWEKLPRRHRKRRRWLGRKSRPVEIPNRVSIRQRPEDVNSRRDFGHWEGDTVVGDQHKTGVHTEVERVSRLLFAHPVPHIRAKEPVWPSSVSLGAFPNRRANQQPWTMGVRTIYIRSCKRSWVFGRILPIRTVPGSGEPTNTPMDYFGGTSPNGPTSETLPRNSSMSLFTD
jgi:transposase, IS30 family